MTRGVMMDPVSVKVAEVHDATTIDRTSDVDTLVKMPALVRLNSCCWCEPPDDQRGVLQHQARNLAVADGTSGCRFYAVALHGDLEQKDHNHILILLANQSASILVATDVAARRYDIAQLDAVFNY